MPAPQSTHGTVLPPPSPNADGPRRRCVVCRISAPKSVLLRVVRRPDGALAMSDHAHGRGAYLHRDAGCLRTAAAQPKHLARALRCAPTAALLSQLQRIA